MRETGQVHGVPLGDAGQDEECLNAHIGVGIGLADEGLSPKAHAETTARRLSDARHPRVRSPCAVIYPPVPVVG